MDELKRYLDLAGLAHYDEKIKAYIKTNGSDVTDKLVALIGAAEKGESEATILARITDLEDAVGDVSELEEGVANLVKAILGESARAKEAEEDLQDAIDALDLSDENATSDTVAGIAVKVEQEDGQISKPVVTVADNEVTYTAATETTAANLTIAEGKSGDVLKGEAIAKIKSYVDEKASDAAGDTKELTEKLYGTDTEEGHANGDIDDINDALDILNGEDTVNGSVAKSIKDAIDALDVESNDSDKVAGIQIGVTEENGKVQKPSLTVDDNAVTYTPAVPASEGVEAQAAKLEVTTSTAVLKGDAIAVIKSYVDAMDAANAGDADDRLDALEALHKTSSGKMMTVAEEIAEVVADAPEAFDTLKEIADWIQKDAENENGFDAANRIVALETAISAKDAEGKFVTVPTQITNAVEALDSDADDTDAGVKVSVKIEDGKLTENGVAVEVTAAEVTRTAYKKGEGEEADTAPALVVAESDVDKVVDGSVIAKIVGYVDDKVAMANSAADEAIKALNLNGDDAVSTAVDGLTVKVEQTEGQISAPVVAITNSSAVITPATGETAPSVAFTNKDNLADGNLVEVAMDYAEAYTDYVVTNLDATVSQNAEAYTTTNGLKLSVTQTDGKLTAISGDINTITTDDIDALFAEKENP